MASSKVLLYKSKKKADGRYPIVIRIIKDRRPKYLYIDWIYEKDWDELNCKVKTSHLNCQRLNNLILKKRVEADDLILESEAQKNDLTAGQITKIMKGQRRETTFLKLASEFISDLKKTGKYNRASADESRINVIKSFLNNEDIFFHEIDESWLKRLKVFLISKRNVSERTVMNYYIVIRTLFNIAITQGIVEQKFYPFGKRKIRIKIPDTLKIGLDEDEIKTIEGLDLSSGIQLMHTRNVFLTSFYLAGARISDVLRIRWSDIQNDRLYYKMGKNNKGDSLKIPSKLLRIFEAYKSEKQSESDFIFPELKKADLRNKKDINTKIKTAGRKFNKYLKDIMRKAEINKKVTNHIARHTFGNIAGDKISPQMLQKLYRHTNLSTTIGYQGNFIHKNTDEALDTILTF